MTTAPACPVCQKPIVSEATFCHHCGAQLQEHCRSCEANSPKGSGFCQSCGARLSGLPVPGSLSPAYEQSHVAMALPCPRCSASNEPTAQYCYRCGLPLEGVRPLAAAATREGALIGPAGQVIGVPAGFWVRVAAALLDGVLLNIAGLIIIGIAAGATAAGGQGVFGLAQLVNFLLGVAYHVVGWSVYGTTIGKKAMNLYVVRPDGTRVGPGRAFGRYMAQILSYLILLIGVLMVAFRKDRRALHDLIADTYVVTKR